MRLKRITWKAECVRSHSLAMLLIPQFVERNVALVGAHHDATEATVEKCGCAGCDGEISAVFGYGPVGDLESPRQTHAGCGVRQ